MPQTFFRQLFLLLPVNFLSFVNPPLTGSSSLYKGIQLTTRHCVYHFSVRSPWKSLQLGRENIVVLEFVPSISRTTHWKIERINYKISRSEVSVLFNQTFLNENIIYIYIWKSYSLDVSRFSELLKDRLLLKVIKLHFL